MSSHGIIRNLHKYLIGPGERRDVAQGTSNRLLGDLQMLVASDDECRRSRAADPGAAMNKKAIDQQAAFQEYEELAEVLA